MNRPSLDVKATTVRIDPELLARVDELVGVGRRSEVIREALRLYVDGLEFARELSAKNQ